MTARTEGSASRAARRLIGDVAVFSRHALAAPPRDYQLEVARAVAASVLAGLGLTFTVVFPRQAGKNELSAQLEAFLLLRHSRRGGSLVKSAPTLRPQLVTSLLRLERLLQGPLTRGRWRRLQGCIVQVGEASCRFLSAQPGANIVGATASLLLEGDEAQDLDPTKWDRDLRPMAAAWGATSVLYGTPWTTETLLAREVARNLELERHDGIRRHFQVGWERVAEVMPAYQRHVEAEIARLGEHHPIVRTQYLLRELERGGRLLSREQLERLRGDHGPLDGPPERPAAWGVGAFVAGLDVAGADEEDPEGLLVWPAARRDATVLTIAFAEEARVVGAERVVEPRLRVVRQYAWRGAPHRLLYPVVLSLVGERWRCRAVVVDATGIGSGLAAFLSAALGPRIVRPYLYTAASKSVLAYDFLAAVNAERVKVHAPTEETDALHRELFAQAAAATYELRSGQIMRWSVPAAHGHDDLLNALVLCVQASPLSGRRAARGSRIVSAWKPT